MSKQPNPIRGYSLIELVVVIAIVSILAAMAVPRFSSAIQNQRCDAAARRIVVDLKFARNRARSTSSTVTVRFDNAANIYGIDGLPDMDHPDRTYSVAMGDDPFGASFTFSAASLQPTVAFDGYGIADSNCSIMVTVGKESRTITLDKATGKITASDAETGVFVK